MVTKPEYFVGLQALDTNAELHTTLLKQTLSDEAGIVARGKFAQMAAADENIIAYYESYKVFMHNHLADVAKTATNHYADLLGVEVSEAEKAEITAQEVARLKEEPYHGLTYEQRLTLRGVQTKQLARKKFSVGAKMETKLKNLAGLFVNRYPFGSASAMDKRLMLGEQVRLEHNIAKRLFLMADEPLVKWILSEHHAEEDECDRLASAIDPAVEAYIEEHNLDIHPRGVYFVNDLPAIPHPNCQCTLGTVMISKLKRSRKEIRNVLATAKKLLSKLRNTTKSLPK